MPSPIPSSMFSRRTLLQLTATTALAAALPVYAATEVAMPAPLKLGIASYSFRGLSLDNCIKAMSRLNIKYCSIKDVHLPLDSSSDQRKATLAKFKAAGITPLSAGVITIPNDPAAARNAFEYGRDLQLLSLVVNPTAEILPTLDKLVKEFDIRIAIHNHGPGDAWPAPADAFNAIKTLDPRMGLCIDVGHTARAGVDPAAAILQFKDRLFDLHLKDLSALDKGTAGEIEIGRGILNIKAMLAALQTINYQYHVGIEHEKDSRDPIPGVAESLGYVRGLLSKV